MVARIDDGRVEQTEPPPHAEGGDHEPGADAEQPLPRGERRAVRHHKGETGCLDGAQQALGRSLAALEIGMHMREIIVEPRIGSRHRAKPSNTPAGDHLGSNDRHGPPVTTLCLTGEE